MKGLVSEDLSGMFVRTLLTVRDNFRTDILRRVLQQWDPSSGEYMSYFRSVMSSICKTGRLSEDIPCSGGSFLSVMKLPQEYQSGMTFAESLPPRAIDFTSGPGRNFEMEEESHFGGQSAVVADKPDFVADSERKVVSKMFGPAHTTLSVELSEYIFQQGYTCLLYTSPSPRDRTRSRMPSSA